MATVETNGDLSAPAEERSPAGFEIDGELYELPRLGDITIDEERILYLFSDTVLSDFMPAPADADEAERLAHDLRQMGKLRNPDFKRALAHIAYRRRHPEVPDGEISQAIGGLNALAVDIALLRGDDANPPAESSQKQLESRSGSESPTRSEDSGSDTPTSSAPVEESPAGTGIIESAISSPGAVPTASVS
jgi:hypothetical protein